MNKQRLSIEEPLKAAMVNKMRNVFIPAFESISSHVVQQVTGSASKASSSADGAKSDALTAQVAAMSVTMERMMHSIEPLKQSTQSSGPPQPL